MENIVKNQKDFIKTEKVFFEKSSKKVKKFIKEVKLWQKKQFLNGKRKRMANKWAHMRYPAKSLGQFKSIIYYFDTRQKYISF